MFELPSRYPRLCAAVEEIRLIDTHEHLQSEQERLALGDRLDFSHLLSAYVHSDLVSAGMTPTSHDRIWTMDSMGQDEKWQLIAPHWERIRHTGYAQAVRLTVQDVYGIDDLTVDTYRDVTAAMQAHNKPGVQRWLVQEKAGVEWCILHNPDGEGVIYRDNADPKLFRQALAINHFLAEKLPLAQFQVKTGIEPTSWEHFTAIMDWYFERYADQAVAIKNNCPYWRSLRFDDVAPAQAAAVFTKGYLLSEPLTPAEVKLLQDAAFHHCLRRATDYDLPVQIHTGYQAGFRSLRVDWIRPTDLINLFRQYPQVRFDLFHSGYPYQNEVAALVKNYPNVHVDLCWAWIIDPYATRQALRSFIGAVPIHKVFGFGGDYGMADVVYGHARIARWGVAWALAEMCRCSAHWIRAYGGCRPGRALR